MTPVVHQVMPLRDLVEVVLGTTGKDPSRVREVLLRGAVVQGASRFRWESLAASGEDLEAVLLTFPDPDPSRPFRDKQCTGARFRAGRHVIEVPREIGAQRRLFKRRSFWDELMAVAARSTAEYIDYSYRTRSDQYRVALTPENSAAIQQAAELLRYSAPAEQLRANALSAVELWVRYP